MTSANRFKPPEAALDPRAGTDPFSRGPVVALGLLTLLQAACLVLHLSIYVRLISEGMMNPSGPFICLVGCLCLYAGMLRALLSGIHGRNLFLAALVLLLGGLMALDVLRSVYGVLALLPFALACVIAALGLVLTWRRMRARQEAA